MAEWSDEALIAQSRRGDAQAFAQLMRRYERPLFNYLARMLGNGAEAEDMFQETFLRVHTHLDRFREGAPFRPWVYRIATNLCRDRLRYWRRRPQVSLDAASSATPDAPALADRLPAREADPEAAASAAETAARLEAAVAGLSAKHRAVFLMARYEGLPYAEIANALRVPVGTVKSRMNTAVKELLAALKEPNT